MYVCSSSCTHCSNVRLSLQHGACVNAMDLWQFTPLHEAASKNRVEVCSLLLSHGADPTLLNCHSKSAVDMAPTPELKERLTCELSHSRFIDMYTHNVRKNTLTQLHFKQWMLAVQKCWCKPSKSSISLTLFFAKCSSIFKYAA